MLQLTVILIGFIFHIVRILVVYFFLQTEHSKPYVSFTAVCGDFNAHHVSWDEYAQGMPRGAELYNWVKENEMVVLNDDKPTKAARFQQGCSLCAPDITIVNSEAADCFSWQPLNELSSDRS